MILKSILVFIFLLLGYSFFIKKVELPTASQNQNQDNLIKAQNYLFEQKSSPKNVVVGTSLSCHLLSDINNKLYNLSFNGSSIFDGLEIVLNSKLKPSRVFIETNYFFISKSELLTSQLYSPYSYFIAEHFKVFRWNEQPIGKIVSHYNQLGYKIVQKHKQIIEKVKYKLGYKEKISSFSSDQVFYFNLDEQSKNYDILPESNKLLNNLKLLKSYINKLQKSNIEIVLFEMPVNHTLINKRLSKRVRAIFNKSDFNKFSFIPVDTTYQYRTTDGVHLKENESKIYTHYFDSFVLKNKW
jgi:hypothetical protein